MLSSFVVIAHYLQFIYFSETKNVLGAEIFSYNKEKIYHILEASGMLSTTNFALGSLLLASTFIPFWMASRSNFKTVIIGAVFMGLGAAAFFVPLSPLKQVNPFEQNAAKSKWVYFFNSTVDHVMKVNPEIHDLWKEVSDFSTEDGQKKN